MFIKSANFKQFESPVTPVGSQIDLTGIDPTLTEGFAGIVYFNNMDGVTPVTPTGGTATFKIKTIAQPQGFQVPVNDVIMATSLDEANWSANVTDVNVVFATIVGATHAKLIVSVNLP